MASIILTPYDLQIITRWIRVKTKDAMKECKEDSDESIEKRTPGGFTVSYDLQWNDDEEQEVWCYVTIPRRRGAALRIFQQKLDTAHNADPKVAERMIENIISELKSKTFKFCNMPNCYSLAVENDQCVDCYVHDWHRGEECCICKEDDGHWVSMNCDHIIHYNCFHAMDSKKCPLCRAPATLIKDVKF